jgi:hypothetical protein
VTTAAFVTDGRRIIPQPIARAGWYDDALHGGPVAAALARAVEAVASPVDTTVTRLTVDLLRPIPTRPLEIRSGVVRQGRRIQVVDAVMESEGSEVARAAAMRIRTADVAVPEHERRPSPPPPHGLEPYRMLEADEQWFHSAAVEARFVSGDFYEPGPATVWMRLVVPLVEGEEPTPLQRVAALADFGNGLSRVLPWGWLFINSDLTVHLSRQPRSEWVCLRSRTELSDHGMGLAESELFDEEGAIGHSAQSLVVERMDG